MQFQNECAPLLFSVFRLQQKEAFKKGLRIKGYAYAEVWYFYEIIPEL